MSSGSVCGMKKLEGRSVPSEWPKGKQVKLAFVGEAPGQEEMEDGRPFVGSAGRIFDRLLRASNIERAGCYVGNVFDTKLEHNEVAAERKKRGAEWASFERANVDRLARELQEMSPRLVVALGETALRYLTGLAWNVGSVRGTTRAGGGAFQKLSVFTTYHPAFVMRSWKMFVPTVMDLVKANSLAEVRGSRPERKLYVEPNIDEVEAFLLGACQSTTLLSVDIETAHKVGIIKGIAFAPNQYEAMYVPFVADTPNGCYWPSADLEVRAWKACKNTLECPVPKLGQNFGNYDLPWLFEKAGIYVQNFQEDLMLMHKVLYPELPAGLEFMAGCYSEQGPWKSALRKSHDGKREE